MVNEIVEALRMLNAFSFPLALQIVLQGGIRCEVSHARRLVDLHSLAVRRVTQGST